MTITEVTAPTTLQVHWAAALTGVLLNAAEQLRAGPPEPPDTLDSRALEMRVPRGPATVPRSLLPTLRIDPPGTRPVIDGPTARIGHARALAHPIVERVGPGMSAYRHAADGADGEMLTRTPLDEARPAGQPHRRALLGPPRHPGALDPRRFSCVVATAALEVVSGVRPVAKLAGWVSPTVLDGLTQRRALGDEDLPPSTALDRSDGCGLTAVPALRSSRPTVRRVRTMRVDDRVVESAVVLRWADRCRAVAVRLVAGTGGWRAEALVVG